MTGGNSRGPKPQRGMPNQRHHVANAPAPYERMLEPLRCPAGTGHDVRMEWAKVGGIRTGRLIAWCYTCRCALGAAMSRPATIAELRERRAEASRRERQHRAEAAERRALILEAIQQGERQVDIAARLGLTPQRVHRLLQEARRRTA